MVLPLEYGIGIPSPLKVVYDESGKLFKCKEDVFMRSPCFALTSADLKLRLCFAGRDRTFSGLYYLCGPLEKVERAEVTLPSSTDGSVKIPKGAGAEKGITYVVAPYTGCYLGKESDVALISILPGTPQSCFKIAQNLILGVDASGNLHSLYILL